MPAQPASNVPSPLQTASPSPADVYDVALLDLDGVVYLVRDPVPGAAAALAAARDSGMRLAFVTNNASRSPDDVVALLGEVGVKADPGEVVTSAQAAGRVLAERLPPGARVLVIGADELRRQVTDRGLTAVDGADESPQAVVCGYSPDVGWRQLAEASVAVGHGAFWLATNTDTTLPSVRGALPGNGSLMGVITAVTGVRPHVAGKPDPALHRESVERTEARNPIIVGDRLDTDIEGAARAGCPSMLVLSGVTSPAELLGAAPHHRPTFVAADVGGLVIEQPAVESSGDNAWRCRDWRATVRPDRTILIEAADGADPLDGLRVACVASWSSGGRVVAADPTAAAALTDWGIPAD